MHPHFGHVHHSPYCEDETFCDNCLPDAHCPDPEPQKDDNMPGRKGPDLISRLPPELLLEITKQMDAPAKFALKMTSSLFLKICPDWETLHNEIKSKYFRYALACTLNRTAKPDSYLCSACHTRHPSSYFSQKMKNHPDSSRVCLGHELDVPVLPKRFLSFPSARDFVVDDFNEEAYFRVSCNPGGCGCSAMVDNYDNMCSAGDLREGIMSMVTANLTVRAHKILLMKTSLSICSQPLNLLLMLASAGEARIKEEGMFPFYLREDLKAWNYPLCKHIPLSHDKVLNAVRESALENFGKKELDPAERSIKCTSCQAQIKISFEESYRMEREQHRRLHKLNIEVEKNLGSFDKIKPGKRWMLSVCTRKDASFGPKWNNAVYDGIERDSEDDEMDFY